MLNIEIKKRIDENNARIEKLLTPNIFIMNNLVAELLKENEQLQSSCSHEYEDDFCKYCYKIKE